MAELLDFFSSSSSIRSSFLNIGSLLNSTSLRFDILFDVDFFEEDLLETKFAEPNLEEADFTEACFLDADFLESEFAKSPFSDAHITEADNFDFALIDCLQALVIDFTLTKKGIMVDGLKVAEGVG